MTNNETVIKNILHELGHTNTIEALRHSQKAFDLIRLIDYWLYQYGSVDPVYLRREVDKVLGVGNDK